MAMTSATLSLGPVLFNWAPEVWRDFYFRMADEAPVDTVFVGEVVCSKRAPFFADPLPTVLERLAAAGKEVVLSTPILVTTERERQAVSDLAATEGFRIEANDLGCLSLLAGRPHAIGPFVNVYNEGTLAWLAGRGADAVSLPSELTRDAVAALAKSASGLGMTAEVQVFGRLPLAISARCYHARAHGLHKDGCQFICGRDADGLDVATLEEAPFLAINGTQTLSHTYAALVGELDELKAMGIGRFRLSPHACDMVEVARLYRDRLDGRIGTADVLARLTALVDKPLSNGFYHDREGVAFAGGA
ncbi:MAG TPA: U32 family peptidase [Azospirillaceae bacterium]|nr:U32 family peptidase [Azospirillaceae bacterium]